LALYCRNIGLTLPHSVANPLYTVCYVTCCSQPPPEDVYIAGSFKHCKCSFRV
jgi:hypothetical protein